MSVVTRFNPSCNSLLHLGHIYMALVNETFARERGGRFIVRWDDSHLRRIRDMGKERISRILQSQMYDLDWVGIEPDEFIRQSDVIDDVRKTILESPFRIIEEEEVVLMPQLAGFDFGLMYPLTPMLTAEKVIMDHRMGITHLVRGVDLLSEYSLYQYYCRCSGFPQPRHIYLPRLKWSNGDMSKTMGAQSLADLRGKGYSSQEVRDMLASACLWHTPQGWSLDNLKGAPCL